MKHSILRALTALLLLSLSALSARAETGQAPVRIQVIGETDLYQDQAFKLQIRNEVLRVLRQIIPADAQGEKLFREAQRQKADLEKRLNQYASGIGHHPDIRVETGHFYYPDGRFPAVRVRIGGGYGHNWLGLLYEALWQPQEETTYYSALAEWLWGLFHSSEVLPS